MPKKDKFKINMQEKVDDNVCDLSLSNLASVPVKEIASFKRVTVLDLSCNRLTNLGGTFCSLTRLVKLDLSNNHISILPDNIGNLQNLRHLNLFNNRIEYLPLSFGDLNNLRYLDMKANPLTAVLLDVVGPCLTARDCAQSARCTVHFISYMRSQHEMTSPTPESDIEFDYDSDGGDVELPEMPHCQCSEHECPTAPPEKGEPLPEPAPASTCNSRASSRTPIVDEDGFTLVVSRRNSTCTPTPPGTPCGEVRAPKNKQKKRSNNNNNNSSSSSSNNNKKAGKAHTLAPQTMAAIHQSMERSTRPSGTASSKVTAPAVATVTATASAAEPRKHQHNHQQNNQHHHNHNNTHHHNGHKQSSNNNHNQKGHQQNQQKSHKKAHHKRHGGAGAGGGAAVRSNAGNTGNGGNSGNAPVLASIWTFFSLLVVNVVIIYVMMFKNPEFADRFVELIPASCRQWLVAKSEIFRLRVSDWISEFRTAPDDN